MSEVEIQSLEEDAYGVRITEGATTTHHRVVILPDVLDEIGLADADREQVVRESIAFLLEREPSTSILEEFAVEDIAGYFPEYFDELKRRLAP